MTNVKKKYETSISTLSVIKEGKFPENLFIII